MKRTRYRETRKPSPTVSRRGFLKWFPAGFLTGVGASYVANQLPPLKALTTLLGFRGEQPVEPDAGLRVLLDELFGSSGDVRCYAGATHYLVGGVHSDNAAVQQELVGLVGTVAAVATEGEKSRAFELDPSADWVLIGGPHSSTIASSLLGVSLQAASRPASLRFAYETDNTLVTLKRYRAGGGLQEQSRRSWICDLKNDNIYRPGEGGWLEEDYLLITRMVQNVGGERHYRTIIGGTHGIGTRAVAEFLKGPGRDPIIRRKIAVAPTGAFQILAKVEARSESGKTVPQSVRVLEVHVA